MANYTSVIASNICDAAGNKLASGTVSFQATDASNQPIPFQVGGGGQVVTTPAVFTITNGAIAGGAQVADSANTTPAGILYRVIITDTTLNRVVVTYSLVTVTGTTFNLDTYSQTGAAVLPPTGGSVNGPLTVNGNLSVTGSTAAVDATFGGSVNAKRIENVRYADQFAGVTADVKINAALTDLGGGGTVDCRGLGATAQTIASTVVINSGQTLICDPATTFQPSGNSVDMFSIKSNGRLFGPTVSITSGTYTAKVFKFDDNYTSGQFTLLNNFRISALSNTSGGYGIYLGSTSSSQHISFVYIQNGVIDGMQNGVYATASGTGFVNGNFIRVVCDGSIHGFNFLVDATGVISANDLSGCTYQWQAASPGDGLHLDASAGGHIQHNFAHPILIFDTTTPVTVVGNNVSTNVFSGMFNGTISDSTGQNSYLTASVIQDSAGNLSAKSITVQNNQAFSSLDSGGSGVALLYMDASNNTHVQAESSKTIDFDIAGSTKASITSAGLTVGTGTALARYTRYTPTLSPSSVAANTTAEQTFTNVLTSGDVVVGVSKPTAQAGLGIVGWRASGTSLLITFSNNTGSPITPTASEVYQVVAVQ